MLALPLCWLALGVLVGAGPVMVGAGPGMVGAGMWHGILYSGCSFILCVALVARSVYRSVAGRRTC